MNVRPTRHRLTALVLSIISLSACTAEDGGGSGPASSGVMSGSVSPQGRVLLGRPLSADEVGHFQMAADGSGETPFAPGSQFEARQLSPDGSTVSIVAMGDAGVMVGGVVGVDGSGLELFGEHDPTLNLACGIWAPRGRMACEGWDETDPSRAGMYTVRADDGGDLRRLTHASDIPCDYAPDGAQLAFLRVGEDGIGTLMAMDTDDGDVRALAEGIEPSGVSCDWSPDGATILAASVDGSLVMITPDGEHTTVTGDGIDGDASGAVWSPDGTSILFSMVPAGDDLSAAYVVARDGSGLVRLTDEGAYEEAALWLS